MDTAWLSTSYGLPKSYLSTWPHYDRNGKGETFWMSIFPRNGAHIGVTYHTHDQKGNPIPLVIFRFSCPKMISLCNHNLVSNLEEVIEIANSNIHRIPDFSRIKLEECSLSRADLCCHHHVGDKKPEYLRSFRDLLHPHRVTFPFKYGGTEFRSKQSKLMLYPKYEECGHQEVEGVIRQEEQIRGKGRIAELLGIKNPTLLDINKDFAVRILQNNLVKLRLNDVIITDRETAADILVREYGASKGSNLFGFWLLRQTHDKKELQSKYKYSPESINAKERMIAKAGVAMVSSKVTLPPLKVEL